ncbi:MAG: N-acetylmuramoyl-L-alanine amidase family protein [Culicoidibacterales bacterium]
MLTAETVIFEDYYFYGESLHLELEQPIQAYQLINLKTNETFVFESQALDQGIELATLPVGTYTLFVNGSNVISDVPMTQTWYTMTRKKRAKMITLEADEQRLLLEVTTVKKLPDEVYDIVIDPGHGGLDSGTTGYGLYESDEVLKISKYLQEQLTKKGFKVKLTRTTDVEPAGDESFNGEESPYYENGRIEQVYASQAKIFISNHLNATESSLASGFQLYSSYLTTNTLAQTLADSMLAIGMEASTLDNPGARGSGTFQTTDVCVERIEGEQHCRYEEEDYYFTVRESGGEATSAQKLQLYNKSYQSIPNYGAQAVLIEYGFINNLRENTLWQENWQSYADAVVEAIVKYVNE